MVKIFRTLITLAVLTLTSAALATPTVTITSPANGSTISRSQTAQLRVTGAVAFDAPTPMDAKYYLRQTGPCQNGNGTARFLAPTFAPTDNESCGYNENITPANELVGTATGQPANTMRFPLQSESLPITLDASKPITGTIQVNSMYLQSSLAVGTARAAVDVAVVGTTQGAEQTLGSQTISYEMSPGGAPEKHVAFSITPAGTADKRDFSALSLSVVIRGVNVLHGWIYFRGRSHVTVPQYTASFDRRVEVAIDGDPASSSGVTVAPDFRTWTAMLPVPGTGTHVIKAQAAQGAQRSGPAQVTLQVSP